MTKFSKMLTGAAAAAVMTVGMAAPAQAQYYRHYDRDRGLSLGDVATGIAVVGGVAAVAGALSSASRNSYNSGYYGQSGYGYAPAYGYNQGYYGNQGYGYGNQGYGHGGGYGEQAALSACSYQAQRYGRASIVDIDRRNRRSYRVRGVIDAGHNGGYYNRGYGSQRIGFTCTARDNGQVTRFNTDRNRY